MLFDNTDRKDRKAAAHRKSTSLSRSAESDL